MKRPLIISLLVAIFVAGGCTPLRRGGVPPAGFTVTAALGPPTLPAATTATPAPADSCFYVWASHELPDLSGKLQSTFQAADAGMSASAYAYGEDCVFADGHRDFSAMETDFRVRIKVADFKDEQTLGNGIARAMSMISQLPTADLAGGRAGQVAFSFYVTDSQELHLSVDVDKYHGLPRGISGAQLFRQFYGSP